MRFHESKGTAVLIEFVSDERFVQACLRFKYSPGDIAQVGLSLLESFVRALYHLSKNADSFKNDWDEMNATLKLMKFSSYINRYKYLLGCYKYEYANHFRIIFLLLKE